MNFATELDEDVFSRWEIMLDRSTSYMVVQQYQNAIEILCTAESQVLEVLVSDFVIILMKDESFLVKIYC
jgi:hypothetical protein